jgi:hypothetical protein
MARINTYKTDLDVQDLDKWIGTDSSTGKTRNFTPQGIADNFNKTGKIGIGGQVPFIFYAGSANARKPGTISFPNGGGDTTAFSTVTNLVISEVSSGNIYVLDYLNHLKDNAIYIFNLADPNVFAIYNVNTLSQNLTQPSFYDASVSFIEGNGIFKKDAVYGVVRAPEPDKKYVYIQNTPETTWTITHNLQKYPSVTIVDSSESVVIGEVNYTNNNQLTVTFNGGFSGKAYLN